MRVVDASGPVIGIGAVVVKNGCLLMVQRGHEPAKGSWSIPGGRLEQGEYISDALAREVREETGLSITPGTLLGVFEVPGDPHYVILDYVATTDSDDDPIASSDAADARWVPLDEIDSLDTTPRFAEMMKAWGVLSGETSADE
jgi:8-oxo-dGTP diphosphatase